MKIEACVLLEMRVRKSKFTESQFEAILAEGDAGLPVAYVYRKHGISNAPYYQLKSKYSGLSVDFMRDTLYDGSPFVMFNVIDEGNR